MLDLHAVQKKCGDLTAGLSQIAIIDPADLVTQPKWYAIPSILELSFLPGKAAFFLHQDAFSGRLTGKPLASAAGDYYEYALALTSRGVRVEMDYFRAKVKNRRVHAICTYEAGGQKCVPNIRLFGGEDSGDRGTRNGYSFSGQSLLINPAPWIGAVVNVIGPPYIPPDPGGGGSGGGGGFAPVEVTTSSSGYIYSLTAGKFLMAIFIKSTSDQTVSIGYSAGNSELAGPVDMVAGVKYQFGDNWILADSNINIYISGLAGTNTIQICVLEQ
jgi:hypothetical protein